MGDDSFMSRLSSSSGATSLTRLTHPSQPDLERQSSVEVQLGVQRSLDVARLAESVLFAGEEQVADWHSFSPQGLDHQLGLVRRHYLVLIALEECNRHGQFLG